MARKDRRTLLTEMRLEQAQANRVRAVLSDSADEIAKKLEKLGTSGNPLTRMQLEAQRSAIHAVLAKDFKDIGESIASGKVDAAMAASKVVSSYEDTLLKAVMDPKAMKRLAAAEAQRTVNNLEASLKRVQGTSYNPLSKQVYKTQKLATGWVDGIIDKALVSGWSARQLADAVLPSISPRVPGGVSYAANRLARTEINNAYHAASWDRYNRSAIVDEVEWLLSSSHPEDDICNDYAAESTFKKNAVPAKPHPNCYCYIVPRLPTEEEFLDRLFAGEYGDEPWSEEARGGISMPGMTTSRSAEATYKGSSEQAKYADLERAGYIQYADGKMKDLSLYDGIPEDQAIARINATLQKVVDEGDLAIQVRSADVDSILSSGFKSGFETRSGAGGMNARYYEQRDWIEHINFGERVVDQRPIYGYLDSDAVRTGAAKNYGDVKFLLKDDVRDYTSVSWGDSLNSKSLRPSPAKSMDWYSVDADLGAYRDVLAGSVREAQTAGYVELQIHKPLGASDIKSIVFPVQPGSEITEKLKLLNIDWEVA